jgi:hypothetical protein
MGYGSPGFALRLCRSGETDICSFSHSNARAEPYAVPSPLTQPYA